VRDLVVSIGVSSSDIRDNARVRKTAHVSFEKFVESMLKHVPETDNKASAGWVCGAEFDPPYRDSENFVARHLLSFDYDRITPAERNHILGTYRGLARLAYTTWSSSDEHPRLRIWLPLSRPTGYDEFSAVSRAVAARAGIELAARESHVPAQYMYRPAIKPGAAFWSEADTTSPWVDVDQILGEYDDWRDRTQWPHRAEGDGVHNEGTAPDPRTKPGIVGAFCRAYSVLDAIEKFDLPYKPGSSPGRLTYTLGSRPDGAIVYDDDTKLHSHHDTDPARGQVNAYDLVRLHRFGWLDSGSETAPLSDRPSSRAMAEWAQGLPPLRDAVVSECGFTDLEATDFEWLDGGVGADAGAQRDLPAVGGASAERGGQQLPDRILPAISELTDQGNARRIQRKYAGKIIAVGGVFYVWTGTHWAHDDQQVYSKYVSRLSQLIKAEADKAYEEAGQDEDKQKEAAKIWQWAIEAGNVTRKRACIAELLQHLDVKADQLNRDLDLLACANGIVDLRTGALQAPDPKLLMTACAPVAYDAAAKAPRFEQFLREIYDHDESVIAFAKRWLGYCITGHVNEHKIVFHVGRGGNGKSTLMSAMHRVLGDDYYSTQNSGLLTLELKGATPELARLLGRRMVTISETPDGLEIRDGLVKSLTGGDRVVARQLFKDVIEFDPTHKLQIFTNHRPVIKGQDEGIWRRVILLNYPKRWGDPAEVAAGQADYVKDINLDAALAEEAPGILCWLIEGAQEWYARGLDVPETIRASTARYRTEQDIMQLFVSERLTADPEARIALSGTTGALFPAYQGWCRANGHHSLGRVRFCQEIERIAPYAVETKWMEGRMPLKGYTGLKLNDD